MQNALTMQDLNSNYPAPIELHGRRVWIGCSGYVYPHWRGPFYPPDLPQKRWLDFYAHYFPTVELNNTFYILPAATTFEKWRDTAPKGFLYAVKASRFITHMKKLSDPRPHLEKLFERASLLGDKLGPVLYQLPPRWGFNPERFEAFLQALPRGVQQAVEVRDTSWLNDTFFALLERFSVAYCITSLPDYRTPVRATAPFAYFRFHGSGQMYYYRYSHEELRQWRDAITRFSSEGRTVYAYFDNDPNAWAVENALELMEMLRQ
jgi:uncharacterized protein YecE (DUF72 family)